MTTLASYLLIAFRNDEVSRANALKALWMNQIGGVVILLGALVAIIGFKTVMFDTLLQSSGGMVLFLSHFSRWRHWSREPRSRSRGGYWGQWWHRRL
jgi:NADH:ubiquinone oxidoreductase subunit 5 (subunit L)/multisubunit Na+/H+ antiporter MnhA subunit